MMAKWNLKETDTDKICSLGCGVFIRKSDVPAWHEMCDRHEAERKEAMQDDEYIYQMFRYELANHEYCITYDLEDTLNALDLTYEEVVANKRLHEALKKAKEDYLNNIN